MYFSSDKLLILLLFTALILLLFTNLWVRAMQKSIPCELAVRRVQIAQIVQIAQTAMFPRSSLGWLCPRQMSPASTLCINSPADILSLARVNFTPETFEQRYRPFRFELPRSKRRNNAFKSHRDRLFALEGFEHDAAEARIFTCLRSFKRFQKRIYRNFLTLWLRHTLLRTDRTIRQGLCYDVHRERRIFG